MATPVSYSDQNEGSGPRAVRVFARWRDDPGACRLAFDAVLAGDRLAGDWPIFGATDPETPAQRPFLLDRVGLFHFAGADRLWRTDLREAAFRVGARFRVWWSEEDKGEFEIVKLAALGHRSASAR